jgi:hypothetical protein
VFLVGLSARAKNGNAASMSDRLKVEVSRYSCCNFSTNSSPNCTCWPGWKFQLGQQAHFTIDIINKVSPMCDNALSNVPIPRAPAERGNDKRTPSAQSDQKGQVILFSRKN